MKAVLISIQPRWCEKIASGKKTIEVRKNRPKLEPPFKVYIYCTSAKPYLVWGDVFRGDWNTEVTTLSGWSREDAAKVWDVFNGKVIGEFVCDKIFPIRVFSDRTIQNWNSYGMAGSLVVYDDVVDYIGPNHTGYGWHISDLEIYDTPKELTDYYGQCKKPVLFDCSFCHEYGAKTCKPMTRPPQSWCYVEE